MTCCWHTKNARSGREKHSSYVTEHGWHKTNVYSFGLLLNAVKLRFKTCCSRPFQYLPLMRSTVPAKSHFLGGMRVSTPTPTPVRVEPCHFGVESSISSSLGRCLPLAIGWLSRNTTQQFTARLPVRTVSNARERCHRNSSAVTSKMLQLRKHVTYRFSGFQSLQNLLVFRATVEADELSWR